jgi:anthranilate phosphoribosyltransferase
MGAKRDIVILNAATALFVDGVARDIKEGVEMADDALRSGKAKAKLEEIIKISKSL